MSTPKTSPNWTDLRKSDFDASAPLMLFDLDATDNSGQLRKPDACGTPDLFTEGELWRSPTRTRKPSRSRPSTTG